MDNSQEIATVEPKKVRNYRNKVRKTDLYERLRRNCERGTGMYLTPDDVFALYEMNDGVKGVLEDR